MINNLVKMNTIETVGMFFNYDDWKDYMLNESRLVVSLNEDIFKCLSAEELVSIPILRKFKRFCSFPTFLFEGQTGIAKSVFGGGSLPELEKNITDLLDRDPNAVLYYVTQFYFENGIDLKSEIRMGNGLAFKLRYAPGFDS